MRQGRVADDLVEHLSNPGLFLDRCREHLKQNGRLILTTPNTFNLYNIAEKLTKFEATINKDHTAYHNYKTLRRLLQKNGFEPAEFGFTKHSFEHTHRESWKRKILNVVYWVVSKFTKKFLEGLVIVAVVRK